MRSDTWPARLVFAAAAAVMIATSPPPTWGERKQLHGEFQSEGQGDDKLLRVHVQMAGGIAKDVRAVDVRVTGTVDRPASDLTILWLGEVTPATEAGVPAPFGSSEDFLTVFTTASDWQACPDNGDVCDRLFEGRIATQSSIGYSMSIDVEVAIRGSREDTPPGTFTASLEVLDAP